MEKFKMMWLNNGLQNHTAFYNILFSLLKTPKWLSKAANVANHL